MEKKLGKANFNAESQSELTPIFTLHKRAQVI